MQLSDDPNRQTIVRILLSLSVFFALTAITTVHASPGLTSVAHYAFLFAAVALSCESLRWSLVKSRHFLAASIAIAFAVCYGWSHFDWYEHHWTGDGLANREWQYTDVMTRREGRVIYRTISGDFGSTWFLNRGPMARDGVPHGHWTHLSAGLGQTDRWYWYGEEITEGEWHLRNR